MIKIRGLSGTMRVKGIINPVFAVYLFFKKIGLQRQMNKQSFREILSSVGDIDTKEGFVVNNLKAVQRLCKLGKFQIWAVDGMIVAKMAEN